MSGTIFDLLTPEIEKEEEEKVIDFSPTPTPIPSPVQPKASPQEEKRNFFDFSIFGVEEEPESEGEGLRPVGRITKGFASGLFGSYGDILDFVRAQPKERLLPGQEALMKAEAEAPESLKPFFTEDDIVPSYSRLPGTAEIKEFARLLGAPGEPQTGEEKALERAPEFLGSLLSFGGRAAGKNIATKFAKTIFRGLTPGIVSVAAEEADLPPWAQAASTIAASLVAHRVTGKSLSQINSETYKKAYSLLPETAEVSSGNLEKIVKSLNKSLLKGGQAPSEKAVLDFSSKVLGKISGGKIKVEELTALKRSLNEIISLDEVRRAPKRARTLLKQISGAMDESINQYGKSNPKFLKLYREANSAFKGINEASYIESFIKKHPLVAVHGGATLKYLLPSVTGTTALTGTALVKATEVAAALARNPGLRKLYFKFLQNASQDLVKPASESLRKFNEQLKEELPDLDL